MSILDIFFNFSLHVTHVKTRSNLAKLCTKKCVYKTKRCTESCKLTQPNYFPITILNTITRKLQFIHEPKYHPTEQYYRFKVTIQTIQCSTENRSTINRKYIWKHSGNRGVRSLQAGALKFPDLLLNSCLPYLFPLPFICLIAPLFHCSFSSFHEYQSFVPFYNEFDLTA